MSCTYTKNRPFRINYSCRNHATRDPRDHLYTLTYLLVIGRFQMRNDYEMYTGLRGGAVYARSVLTLSGPGKAAENSKCQKSRMLTTVFYCVLLCFFYVLLCFAMTLLLFTIFKGSKQRKSAREWFFLGGKRYLKGIWGDPTLVKIQWKNKKK